MSWIPPKQGYFILCLKSCDKVKLVNASNSVVKQVTAIVRRHCNIVRCGWDRHYAYFYKLQPQGSSLLGWELRERKIAIGLTTEEGLLIIGLAFEGVRSEHLAPKTNWKKEIFNFHTGDCLVRFTRSKTSTCTNQLNVDDFMVNYTGDHSVHIHWIHVIV